MLKFECMYFLNQLALILRISDGILKMYFMWIFFREHQKPNYYAKSSKERKEFAKFYPHKNLSTKLANKYTLENEMK